MLRTFATIGKPKNPKDLAVREARKEWARAITHTDAHARICNPCNKQRNPHSLAVQTGALTDPKLEAYQPCRTARALHAAEVAARKAFQALGGALGALVILLIPSILLGCQKERAGEDPYRPFYPHVAQTWTTTPAGHVRDADPKKSIEQGFTTDAEVDSSIDAGYEEFYSLFPEFRGVEGQVNITDDYVEVDPDNHVNAPGLSRGTSMFLCLWTRKTSETEPIGCYLKREPGTYFGFTYTEWRYTARPLFPRLTHELLHVALGGDAYHTDTRWSKVPR